MHSSRRIQTIVAPKGTRPGTCHTACPCGVAGPKGFFVHRNAQGRALLDIHVRDHPLHDEMPIPLMVDTGAEVTVIPRRLVGDRRAFPASKVSVSLTVPGRGGSTVGSLYEASLSIQVGAERVSLGWHPVVVVSDDWKRSYGLLGAAAMGSIMLVLDDRMVTLWDLREAKRLHQ